MPRAQQKQGYCVVVDVDAAALLLMVMLLRL
jgi:hypothetical protein